MKPVAIKSVLLPLLLVSVAAMLLAGCYWEPGPDYPGPPDSGYYGGYPQGFYQTDVIIGVGGHERHDHDEGHRDSSHIPAHRIPAPAPRPMPHGHPDGHPGHDGR